MALKGKIKDQGDAGYNIAWGRERKAE